MRTRFASARASCCSGSTRIRRSCCRPPARRRRGDSAAELAATAVAAHCRALVDARGGACVGVKLQLACFERLGWPGARALARGRGRTRAAPGLLVVADGKRGDVPHTAAAYGQALLGATDDPVGTVPGLGADAVTANPLLGRDSLEPIVGGRARGGRRRVRAGAHVEPRRGRDPGRLAAVERRRCVTALADLVHELGADGVGAQGSSDVGAVVAATEPSLLAALRERMPNAVLLLPGVGAQGGRVEDLAPAFAGRPGAALVTVSRSIARAAIDAGDAAAARPVAEELREAAWAVAAGSVDQQLATGL